MAQYADIITIDAPSEAQSGKEVSVRVDVKNISPDWLYVVLTGIIEYDTTQVPFETPYGYWSPPDMMPFVIVFNMPASKVRFHVSSWYLDGDVWVQDDYAYVDIEVGVENGNGNGGIGDLLTSIMPLIMIMMVFMMITPMMRGMGEGFEEEKPKEIKEEEKPKGIKEK